MSDVLFPSSAQWPQESSSALEPIDVRLVEVVAGPPKEFAIEEGARVSGGPAFVPDGAGGHVIDDAANDALALRMVMLGDTVRFIT